MCGFAGFLGEPGALGVEALERVAADMAARLETRGPDDAGAWGSAAAGVAFGHRRLAIVDLSAAGRQPMASASGRSVIAYNGEVYNFRELRRDLEKEDRRFRGDSDTEVVLEACEAWGVERAVSRFIGMFAFALWDVRARRLTLVRDRLGVKPLYWGRCGGVLLFGSQLKAFAAHPAWRPVVDRDALAAYVRYGYVPAPRSIFRGVEKLEPGCLVTIGAGGEAARRRYWDLRAVARAGVRGRLALTADAAAEALDALLRDAVRRRMAADVPLGAFLSGGIDSSTVVALMQVQSGRPVKSFSIGFDSEDHDEARYARRVARHLGTDHTELCVTPDRARGLLPRLAAWFDEPFGDASKIPTFLVSELARRQVTVALSGDGGDELFAGYDRYFRAPAQWRLVGRWPRPARAALAALLRAPSASAWNRLFRAAPRGWRPRSAAARAETLADLLDIEGPDGFFLSWVTLWRPDGVVLGGRAPRDVLGDPTVRDDVPELTDRMRFLDSVTYLPDDVLTKVDRASMAVGLEARVPLLDHRIVEFAWRLPSALTVRGGVGKWLLRQVLHRYVPRRLVDRPKKGFGVPIDDWLRGPLRAWAEDLLDANRLRRAGYFEPGPIRDAWREHLSGVRDRPHGLWTILMFESWRDAWDAGGA